MTAVEIMCVFCLLSDIFSTGIFSRSLCLRILPLLLFNMVRREGADVSQSTKPGDVGDADSTGLL